MRITQVWVGMAMMVAAACNGPHAVLFDAAPDATRSDASVDAPPDPPVFSDHLYVFDRILLPTKSGEGMKYGLDLDGDGLNDNALGSIMAALSSAAGSGALNLQLEMDRGVARGEVILLADVRALTVTMSSSASLQEFEGATPSPSPCSGPSDTICGHHLDGTGAFTVAATSATDARMIGKIIDSHYAGGPGQALVPVTFGGGPAFLVHVIGARAQLVISNDAIVSGVLAGAIPQAEVDGAVLPQMRDNVATTIARDCKELSSPPACGCGSGTSGATDLSLFDKAPTDCAVSLDELKNNDLIKTLLAPDVMIGGTPALSMGVGVHAVRASFPLPQ